MWMAVLWFVLFIVALLILYKTYEYKHKKQNQQDLSQFIKVFKMDELKFDDPVQATTRFLFDRKKNKWLPNMSLEPRDRPAQVTCLTLNTWFELHFFQERCNALIGIIEKTKPDIVCFQEVTGPFLEIFCKNSTIQENYCLSNANSQPFPGYGVLMMTKKEMCAHYFSRKLPSRMGRTLLVSCFFFSDGSHFCVGTSHLESSRNAPVRKNQLEVIFPILEKISLDIVPDVIKNSEKIKFPNQFTDILFMGDCNYDPKWTDCIEEEVVKSHGFSDIWLELNPGDVGFTQPPKKQHKGNRIDKVFIKSTQCKPLTIQLIGTEDIGTNCSECIESKGACTVSDHFGLFTVLKM